MRPAPGGPRPSFPRRSSTTMPPSSSGCRTARSPAPGSAERWRGGRTSSSTSPRSRPAPTPGAAADRVSDDPDRSEQNPVIFTDPATGAPGLFHTAQPGGRQEECVVRFRPLLARGGRRPLRRAADARPAEGQLRPGAGDAARRRRLDAAAVPLPHRPRRALDRQPRRRRRGDEHRPRRDLGPRRGAGVDRLRPHDAGAARRDACRRLLPPPAGGLRLPHRERRRRPQLVGAGGDRRSEQQLLDCRDRARATGGSRSSATRSTRRSPRRAASRSTTSSARATTAAATPPAAFRQSGACPRAPLTLCLSRDGGRTFPQRRVVEDGPGTCLSNNALDGKNQELSYPAMVEAADGTLHLAFTFHRRAIKHVASIEAGSMRRSAWLSCGHAAPLEKSRDLLTCR